MSKAKDERKSGQKSKVVPTTCSSRVGGTEQGSGDTQKTGSERESGDPLNTGSEHSSGDPRKTGSEQESDHPPKTETKPGSGDPLNTGTEHSSGDPGKTGTKQESDHPQKTETKPGSGDPLNTGTEHNSGDPLNTGTEHNSVDPRKTQTKQESDHPQKTGTEQESDHPPKTGTKQESDHPPKTETKQGSGDPLNTGTEQGSSSPQNTVSESVGHRSGWKDGGRGSVLEKAWRFLKDHKYLMTYVTIGTLSWMCGALTTYWLVNRDFTDLTVEKATERIVSQIESGELKLPGVFNSSCVVTVPETARPPPSVPGVTKGDVEDVETRLRDEFTTGLHNTTANLAVCFRNEVRNRTRRFTRRLNATVAAVHSSCRSMSEKARSDTLDTLHEWSQRLAKRQEDIEERIQLEPEVMEIRGFLKIDTLGPILMLMGAVELMLMLCFCFLLGRGPVTSRRNGAFDVNGSAAQPKPGSKPPARTAIDTNNNNVSFLCFRNGDEERSERLGNQLVQRCGKRLKGRAHVINSMEDVNAIPACRAALVFVDPDEREMIVEDERYHIGIGLRRQAVQRLLDSKVEVFLLIFNDRKCPGLKPDQLYNRQLGQINDHAQLKRLKAMDRIVSFKDSLHEWQTERIVSELNKIFP